MTEKSIDAVELLVSQHRAMEALLKRVAESDNQEEKKTLFAEAGDHLATHIKSEEELFYPAVKAARNEDRLLESLEEHLSLKRLLADLVDMDPEDKTFEAKLQVLTEQAEHHHKEEEEHLFPEVPKLMSQEQREALGREMLALQNNLDRRGDPREAVANETGSAAPLD
ncbi:hemerythrin domain-containing protein [Noviherbaspirillum sp.]|uniref:hemerythrin domain-containing protein n=1 Tax=Noviherbaspirillum sp. TaxID=1926288 RepID=UPI002FE1CF61